MCSIMFIIEHMGRQQLELPVSKNVLETLLRSWSNLHALDATVQLSVWVDQKQNITSSQTTSSASSEGVSQKTDKSAVFAPWSRSSCTSVIFQLFRPILGSPPHTPPQGLPQLTDLAASQQCWPSLHTTCRKTMKIWLHSKSSAFFSPFQKWKMQTRWDTQLFWLWNLLNRLHTDRKKLA